MVRLLPARAKCPPWIRSTDGRDPLLVFADDLRLRLEPLDEVPVKGIAQTHPRLLTTTWAQVRDAGGLVVDCGVDSAAACSVSLLDERRAAASRYARAQPADGSAPRAELVDARAKAVHCLPYRVGGVVRTGHGRVLVPWGSECATGWVPPTIHLSITVSVDAVGRRPVLKKIATTIRR